MSLISSLPDRMAGEQFHIIRGSLTFSAAQIEVTAAPGEVAEGSFFIYGSRGVRASGYVTSSGITMKCLTAEFAGASDEIAWRFDAHGYAAGDSESGYFSIISNQGEYRLPYNVRVESPTLRTGDTEIRDLMYFANLAKTDWAEAVRIFYDPRFGEMLKELSADDDAGVTNPTKLKADPEHALEGRMQPREDESLDVRTSEAWYLWRGLSKYKGNEHNVEEFLISTGKKAAVEYIPDVTEIRTVLPPSDGEQEVLDYYFRLSKNGWGYTNISVEAEGDFLVPQTKTIQETDFDPSNSVEIHYTVNRSRMHSGRNYGMLKLSGPWCSIRIPVEASEISDQTSPKKLRRKEMDTILVKMMQYYEEFRAKHMRGREWLQQTGLLIDRMQSLDPDEPTAMLYKVHLLISSGKQKEAAWALVDFDRRVEEALEIPSYSDPEHRGLRRVDPQLYAYRVYLGVLCAEDESRLTAYDAAERVEEEHRREPGDWRIAWILLYLSDEMRKRPSLKWDLLREEFDRGCRSPIIYIEAYDMIRLSPSIISELDEFALQVLNYASRKDLLNEAVMAQVNALTLRRRTYSEKLMRMLKKAYEKGILKKDTLQSIVSLELRGNRTTEEAFRWYTKGVEAELSLTRLFEYYMMSLPEDYTGEIPQVVLRYFCYQCSLPWKQTAMLYSYIMHHRQECAEIYRQAMPAIREFALSELTKEHVTKDLCYLYWHVINNDVLTPDNAAAAVRVMFCTEIRAEETAPMNAVLIYDKCTNENIAPMKEGRIVRPVYGEDYHLFFEDTKGNRRYASIRYTSERLARYQDKVSMLSAFVTGITDFDRYLTGLAGDHFRISSFNAERFRTLSVEPTLREEYRQEIRLKLLRYYEDSDRALDMDEFFRTIGHEGLTAAQRAEILSYMVLGGQERKALEWIKECGRGAVSDTVLLKLVSGLIGEDAEPVPEMNDDPVEFAKIVYRVYDAGKYNEKMLLFLEKYYEGLSDEMDGIRRAAVRFGTDESLILPRMVTLMLYSGVILEDEEEIISACRRYGVGEEAATALIAQASHYYFVDDVAIDAKTIERIGDFAEKGRPLYDVSRMAFLKNLAARSGEYKADELETAKLFLSDLLSEGIVFPFYRRFAGLLPELQDYSDETLIQFKGRANAEVLLHYSVDREDGTGNEVRQEIPMREMYEGIYVTGFILFFGEQVRYFITDDAERSNVVESGTFGQDTRIAGEGEDRFAMINRISALTAMQKYPEALETMEKYNRKANLVAKIFSRH